MIETCKIILKWSGPNRCLLHFQRLFESNAWSIILEASYKDWFAMEPTFIYKHGAPFYKECSHKIDLSRLWLHSVDDRVETYQKEKWLRFILPHTGQIYTTIYPIFVGSTSLVNQMEVEFTSMNVGWGLAQTLLNLLKLSVNKTKKKS